MSREAEKQRLEGDDPQPGMSRFDRAWGAATGTNGNGVKEHDQSLYALAGELTVRHIAIVQGDRTTGKLLLRAAEAVARAADEMERLRKERDHARRLLCEDESYNHTSGRTPREVADDRGWDCFKEDTND